jgi:hypothetical protein
MVLVALLATCWAAVAIPARATYGARTTADEPQYLLTARSLVRDGDLDISDEIAAREYEPFHEITIDPQTERRADGSELSPHDPLLPVLLAPAMALPGDVAWIAAKATLAVLAGALAALSVWIAVRRFGVAAGTAGLVVSVFAVSPPLVSYGSQVYPEVPAALALAAGIAVATGPLLRGHIAGLVAFISALPWLGVKYAPVAAALTAAVVVTLLRDGRRRDALRMVLALAASGVAFLVVHRMLYGGWTVYASGDHFSQTGELSVVGVDPDYLGRSRRLAGLLLDDSFGLVLWAPAYLVAVVALGAFARRRPPGWSTVLAPLAAGWATATWIALTMHGWWWPGRQVVVVVPCLVLITAWAVDRWSRSVRPLLVASGVVAACSWAWLLTETFAGRRTLIVDFFDTAAPTVWVARALLPDSAHPSGSDEVLFVLWVGVLAGLLAVGWRSGRCEERGSGPDRASMPARSVATVTSPGAPSRRPTPSR